MSNDIKIREANFDDVEQIRLLSDELGYPSTQDEIQNRLEKMLKSGTDKIFVSVNDDETITGWIHVFGAMRLESGSFAEIGGLVVSTEYQNKGIGKALVNAAEKWAEENGYPKIRIRSRTERKDARRFYEREGYQVKKEQCVFEKKL